jgi:hypothetical protein
VAWSGPEPPRSSARREPAAAACVTTALVHGASLFSDAIVSPDSASPRSLEPRLCFNGNAWRWRYHPLCGQVKHGPVRQGYEVRRNTEAVQQRDEADEAKHIGASQLIPGVFDGPAAGCAERTRPRIPTPDRLPLLEARLTQARMPSSRSAAHAKNQQFTGKIRQLMSFSVNSSPGPPLWRARLSSPRSSARRLPAAGVRHYRAGADRRLALQRGDRRLLQSGIHSWLKSL